MSLQTRLATVLQAIGADIKTLRNGQVETAENLRLVRGSVAANGSITVGTGFTITRNGAGDYTVTFTQDFAGLPSITLAVDGAAGTILRLLTPTAHSFRVTNVTVGGVAQDTPWYFIAVGQKSIIV